MITVDSYASSSWMSHPEVSNRSVPSTLAEHAGRLVAVLKKALRLALVMLVWLAVAAVVAAGWWWREQLPLRADSGAGYALGVLSAVCMLVLLIYPLRKRLKFLGILGATKTWFFIHMTMGVTAPVVALYHCGFKLGSLNSQVALASILIVAASGLVGRFLYRHVYADWSGHRAVSKKMSRPKLFDAPYLSFLRLVGTRLNRFDEHTQAHRRSLWAAIRHSFQVEPAARVERLVLMRFCRKQLQQVARDNPLIAREKERLITLIDRYVSFRLLQAQKITRVQIYERLFALWHVVHLPFFILLLLSVIVHVLAVHLY